MNCKTCGRNLTQLEIQRMGGYCSDCYFKKNPTTPSDNKIAKRLRSLGYIYATIGLIVSIVSLFFGEFIFALICIFATFVIATLTLSLYEIIVLLEKISRK